MLAQREVEQAELYTEQAEKAHADASAAAEKAAKEARAQRKALKKVVKAVKVAAIRSSLEHLRSERWLVPGES